VFHSSEFPSSDRQDMEEALHVPLSTLWAYSQREQNISEAQFHHVLSCDSCISAMGLCHILPSLKRVEEEFARYGFDEMP
jgi:hypothetical protein